MWKLIIMPPSQNNTRLYAITPPQIQLSTFVPQVEAAFASGDIACLQLRLKEANQAKIAEAIKELMPIAHAHQAAFIVNDEWQLAAEMGADGVHLGQEDIAETSVKALKKQLPASMVLGITCHASTHLAMEAGEQGADYVAFGAFYETTSKPKEKLEKWGIPSLELLEGWCAYSNLPAVAIGGITPQNCAPLIKAGADFIAVISGVWNHPQGAAAGVQAYHHAIEEALASSSAA